MITGTAELADLFGVTKKTIAEWHLKGMPKVKHGKWDLKQVFHWYLENIHKAEADTQELAEVKLAYWQAKTENEQAKADLAKKRTILVDDIVKAWTWRIQEVGNGLASIPMRVAPMLAHRPEKEVASILESEIWMIRDRFSRTGKFTPTKKGKTDG